MSEESPPQNISLAELQAFDNETQSVSLQWNLDLEHENHPYNVVLTSTPTGHSDIYDRWIKPTMQFSNFAERWEFIPEEAEEKEEQFLKEEVTCLDLLKGETYE